MTNNTIIEANVPSTLELSLNILISISIGAFTLFLITYYCLSRKVKVELVNNKGLPHIKVISRSTKPRFRKRDKVIFYGRKVLRKVKNTVNDEKSKRPREVLKLAKRFLKPSREKIESLHLVRPPPSFFGDDQQNINNIDAGIPPELVYLLKSVRVLGYFENPLSLELCRHVKSISLIKGQNIKCLYPDIYIVQSGKLRVIITDVNNDEHQIKEAEAGQSVYSLLSLLDSLNGSECCKINVSAIADVDSNILCIPASAFTDILIDFPESLVRVIQVMMLRLQRVTYGVLHNQLALTSEILNKDELHSDETEKRKSKRFLNRSLSQPPQHLLTDFDRVLDTARVDNITSSPKNVASKNRSRSQQNDTNEITMQMAQKGMAQVLGLEDEKILCGRVHLQKIKPGEMLIKQGDTDCFLAIVLNGTLQIVQREPDTSNEISICTCKPGELIGALAVLTGEPSLFTIRNRWQSENYVYVGVLLKTHFYTIMREQPKIVLKAAYSVSSRMSLFVRNVDFALDWNCIESGERLFAPGEPADCIYLILSGRLRALAEKVGQSVVVAEYGRGEVIGVLEVLTHNARQTGIMAVRDTEVARIPADLLTYIKRCYPLVVSRLIHLLGKKMFKQENTEASLHHQPANIATVALLPASPEIALSNFALELEHTLSAIGPTLRLTSDLIQNRLGNTALESVNSLRLVSWLGQQEDNHRIVLYECDNQMTIWTKRCIRQADVILIIARYSSKPKVGDLEKQVDNLSVRAHKELVLLHAEDSLELPKHTVKWLNLRGWCTAHHHIRCPNRVLKMYSPIKLSAIYQRQFVKEVDKMTDFSRLARLLTGTSIGLVLGGGGARGLAHVGLIKSLIEAKIPIDIVGGVSIGALIGGLWCLHSDVTKFVHSAREWSKSMNSLPTFLYDLTYPTTSIMTGSAFNNRIKCVLGDERCIEDLWIPFFTITTDLSASKQRLHTSGSLWRYVRASMTLAGYLPPLCDPVDGHLLLDGGYVNNLPADCMKQIGASTVLAIDVGSEDSTDLSNYGDELSGWKALYHRYFGCNKFLSMAELQSRLTYVTCVRQLELVKSGQLPNVEYIRPPINKYGTMQFGSFDEIYEVGYNHGKALFSESFVEKIISRENFTGTNDLKGDFVDLAELISKIDEPYRAPSSASLYSYFHNNDSDYANDYDDDEDEEVEDDGYLDIDNIENGVLEEEDLRTPPEGDPSPAIVTVATRRRPTMGDGQT